MADRQDFNRWRSHVRPFLISKLEEFHLLGMEHITEDELWTFATELIWKEQRKKGQQPMMLHAFVNRVMRLSINDFLNRVRVEMYKEMDLNESRELFR